MRRQLLALAAALLVTVPGGLAAAPATAAAPHCGQVRRAAFADGVKAAKPHADGKYTPIILVHGFISDPGMWAKKVEHTVRSLDKPKVDRSILGNLQALPGAAVYTVDYSATARRWFADPGGGGEAFLKVSDCVAGDPAFAGHPAVVVGHSMGGLIARWADAPGAAERRKATGLVITIGTPYEGSWLSALGNGAGGRARDLLFLAESACGDNRFTSAEPCRWLRDAREFLATTKAFVPGSPELRKLSKWPSGVRVETLTSSAVVSGVAGLFRLGGGSVDLGDIVVGRASATAGDHPQRIAECRYTADSLRVGANTVLERFGRRLDSNTDIPVWLGLLGSCLHIHEANLLEHSAEILGAVAEELRRYDPAPLPASAELRRQGACRAACRITGHVSFVHPSWGQVILITTLAAGDEVREANIVVTDASRTVRWHHFGGDWFELSIAKPAPDRAGNYFLDYNPGRYNGVIVLRPRTGGFDDFTTMPPEDDYVAPFYYAEHRDVDGDGTLEIEKFENDCDPSCAEGTITTSIHRWTGRGYQP
ncbi:alpha/beta fold hydrolase [Actinoplanes sp. NPDC023801]|uniref:esterase/lipase family protein n=1 Tax=Actinoplanes sp. NPDC023801 TaxID=3154595 RepID=UPI0033FB943D